jgi:hypothetical protein
MIGTALVLLFITSEPDVIIDSAWIRPGYEVEVVDRVSLDGFVSSFHFGSRPAFGGQPTFEMIDGVERWQLIIIGQSSVCVFQEGTTPVVYDFVTDPTNVHISSNGRYVVAGSPQHSIDPDSLCRVMLLDLDDGSVLDTGIDLPRSGYVAFTSDQGTIGASGGNGTVDLSEPDSPVYIPSPMGYMYNLILDAAGNHYLMDNLYKLMLFDWNGHSLWSRGGDDGLSCPTGARFLPDGESILCLSDSSIITLSSGDGSVISEIQAYSNLSPVLSHSGETWACLAGQSGGEDREGQLIIASTSNQSLTWLDAPTPRNVSLKWLSCVSDAGRIILGYWDSCCSRYALLDSSGILFYSEQTNIDRLWVNRENAFSNNNSTGFTPTAISSDGTRWITYVGGNEFIVYSIHEASMGL